MDEIERQVRAWADAAAPAAVDGDPVGADEASSGSVAPSPPSRGGRRWLAAAAAMVVVGAVAAGVVALTADESEQVRTGDPTTTTEPDGSDGSDEVAFELLHLGWAEPTAGAEEGWVDQLPQLRTASTAEQLEALWGVRQPWSVDDSEAIPPAVPAPVPEIDFGEQVVVAITIPDDNCPPELRGFRRQPGEDGVGGDRLIPEFVETAIECEEPLIPKQYVVALDWASTGDRFSVFVDGGNLAGDPERMVQGCATGAALRCLPPRSEIRLDRARPARVLVDLELEATTVEAGGSIQGRVVVSNNTGEPIDITYCGAEFAVGLENDEVDQQLVFPMCASGGTIPTGMTAYEVTATASYGTCTTMTDPPPGARPCLPGGAIPPLPLGEYRTRLYPPAGLDGVDDELAITVTAP